MTEPQITLTHKLILLLTEIEKYNTQIELIEIKENSLTSLQTKARATNILHLAKLLGKEITIKEAEKIVSGRHAEFKEENEVLLANFRNAIDFIRTSLKDEYIDLDVSNLLHINKLLLTNWKEVWEVRLRSMGDELDTNLDDWTQLAVTNIDSSQLQDYLRSILDWYKQSSNKVHPLIRSAMVIFYLVYLAPFVNANKFTTIAATEFLLQKSGYAPLNVVPVMKFFEANNEKFMQAWSLVISSGEMSEWVEVFAESLLDTYKGVFSDAEEFIANDKKAAEKPFLDLNRRQLKILKYLQTIPTVRREDYVQMMDVSSMTAFRDLSDLLDKKLLKVDGKGRATRYMLTTR